MSGKSPAKDVITPVQVQRESLTARSDEKLIKRQLVKTLSKMDVTMCGCERNRGSAARDRRIGFNVRIVVAGCSHPSCYTIAQVVVA